MLTLGKSATNAARLRQQRLENDGQAAIDSCPWSNWRKAVPC
jgi:hypothetical protein